LISTALRKLTEPPLQPAFPPVAASSIKNAVGRSLRLPSGNPQGPRRPRFSFSIHLSKNSTSLKRCRRKLREAASPDRISDQAPEALLGDAASPGRAADEQWSTRDRSSRQHPRRNFFAASSRFYLSPFSGQASAFTGTYWLLCS